MKNIVPTIIALCVYDMFLTEVLHLSTANSLMGHVTQSRCWS